MNPPQTQANYESIPTSENDFEFRRLARQLINSAHSEILIVTGELSAALFPELKLCVFAALDRGVKVSVYATSPIKELVDEVTSRRIGLWIGPSFSKNHYMVVDRQTYIVSEKETTGFTFTGSRYGKLYSNDPVGANQIIAMFESGIRSAQRMEKTSSRGTKRTALLYNLARRFSLPEETDAPALGFNIFSIMLATIGILIVAFDLSLGSSLYMANGWVVLYLSDGIMIFILSVYLFSRLQFLSASVSTIRRIWLLGQDKYYTWGRFLRYIFWPALFVFAMYFIPKIFMPSATYYTWTLRTIVSEPNAFSILLTTFAGIALLTERNIGESDLNRDPVEYMIARSIRAFVMERRAEKLEVPELETILARSYDAINQKEGWSEDDKEYTKQYVRRSIGAIVLEADRLASSKGRPITAYDLNRALSRLYKDGSELRLGEIWERYARNDLKRAVGLSFPVR